MDKKAQGISLNFIVIAIIAALVLIIIIAFTVGGLGTSLSKIFQAGEQSTDADLDLAKSNCERLCNDAKQINSPDDWEGESYCTKKYTFEGTSVKCWEEPIGVECSASGDDIYNTFWSCDQTVCNKCEEISCHGDLAADEDNCKVLNHADCTANALCKWEQ